MMHCGVFTSRPQTSMFSKLLLLLLITAGTTSALVSALEPTPSTGNAIKLSSVAGSSCQLIASGADDAPSFVSAVLNGDCQTVVIPAETTLNISTKLDMTGARDTHIVSKLLIYSGVIVLFVCFFRCYYDVI